MGLVHGAAPHAGIERTFGALVIMPESERRGIRGTNTGVLHCVQDDGEEQAEAKAKARANAGVLRCAQNDKQRQKQNDKQRQKQIPFGNDKQGCKQKDDVGMRWGQALEAVMKFMRVV